MNYMSVCSGVEAASLAWGAMGWNPVERQASGAMPGRAALQGVWKQLLCQLR